MSNIQLVDEKETAARLKLSLQKLRNDRAVGRGLPYYKLDRSVRYAVDDINRYAAERRIQTCEE